MYNLYMNLITETILSAWQASRKTKYTPSGWHAGNAVCCDDNRGRGGLIINGDAVSWHCFHCQFKCTWQPGRTISGNMRKLMQYLNIPDDVINKLAIEALRLTDATSQHPLFHIPSFGYRSLPQGAVSINSIIDTGTIPPTLLPVLEYLQSRHLYLDEFDYYWTPEPGFNNRIIIPFYYRNQVVGYTARAIASAKQRYISEQQPGYVFNLDNQSYERKFIVVCEGPIDAISVDGCALLGSVVKQGQEWILNQLNKEIVIVPDCDTAGLALVDKAIENNWSVSLPDWPTGVKDINDAVIKLGRIATLWLIYTAKESSEFRIKLKLKTWSKRING